MNGESPSDPAFCASAPLKILYEDEDYLAVDKPPGLLVHRTNIARDVETDVVQVLNDQLGRKVSPVHRLDRPTSGVLICGNNSSVTGALMREFQERRVRKTYVALVRGHTDDEGSVDRELTGRTGDNGDRRDDGRRLEATSDFRTVSRVIVNQPVGRYDTARYSLLVVSPKTGRYHQIRRHVRSINHPVIGDRKYGDRDHNRYFLEQLEIERMLLQATQLEFIHPRTMRTVTITAELCPDFARALRAIQIDPSVLSAVAEVPPNDETPVHD